MKTDANKAIGFVQDIPGGLVFEVGNASVHRRIHCISGTVSTTSLVNVSSGEEYLEETVSEFEITLSGDGQTVVLDARDFKYEGCDTPTWDDSARILEIRTRADVNGVPLRVSVCYEARAEDNFARKRLRIAPCDLDGWVIRNVTLEKMKLKEMVEGVTPFSRYPRTDSRHEDNVHSEPNNVNVEDADRRFLFGDLARAVVTCWGYGEGLFFFGESLLGEELFHRPTGLVVKQREWAPLTEGLESDPAVIGAYVGPPEIGFKRYNEYLMDHWCVVANKSLPVSWSTWLPTLEDNRPLLANYDRRFLLEYIEYIKEAGFFDVLHLDLGWEAGYPMRVDPDKFPNGMSEIVRRAKEAAGLDMTYWVNPFSASYWKSDVETEHPEWLSPGVVNSRSGATAICPLSDYYEYARRRFVELATELNARVIYWDGNDWNIRECKATGHGHSEQHELEVKAWKRLAQMCRETHQAREDLLFVVFSIPLDNHRLCVLDQEQISDTYSFPTIQSELIQRQQLYQMTWEHPYKAIWGSWYGVNWHDAGEDNLTRRPMRELVHAEMSMIGNGIAQAGGGIDLKQARPEFIEFLRKLFAFRKRFEEYFDTYQHVLGFPDGKSIDGEGHIIGGTGFIVLVNPTEKPQSVRVPLDEPELELSVGELYELTDWSNLERGLPIDTVAIEDSPEIELAPLEVKYIGVNIAE